MFANLIFVTLVTVFVHSEAQVRIVGGKPAKQGDFPYQAFLFFYQVKGQSGFMCSGALISNQYVLTAAHCVTSKTNQLELKNHVKVLLGATNRKIFEESQREYEVSKENFIRHPNYSRLTKENDIALIKLNEPVEFTDYIQAVHLPSRNHEDLHDKTLLTAGWGQLDGHSGAVADVLQYMKTKVVPSDKCSRKYFRQMKFNKDAQICVNSPSTSLCGGDSGGPSVLKENDVTVVVGVNIVSSTFCDVGTPQVMVKVSYYLDWISQNTGIAV